MKHTLIIILVQNVYSIFIHYSPKSEPSKMFNRWIDFKNSGGFIILNYYSKIKRNTLLFDNNVDESQKMLCCVKEGNNRNLHCIVIKSRWKENRRVICLGRGWRCIDWREAWRYFLEWWKCSTSWPGWWLQRCINLSKPIKLYS